MKTVNLKRVLAATALLLIVGTAGATNPLIRISGDNKVELRMGIIQETTQLSIKDLNGFTFYTETIKKSTEAYSKVFDLNILPDGNYKIELEGNVKVVSFPISIAGNKIATKEIEKLVTYKPTVYERGSKIYVSRYNLDHSPLKITIMDSNNAVLYKETLKGDVNPGRVYKFLKSGDYQISMVSNDKTYNQTVSIQK